MTEVDANRLKWQVIDTVCEYVRQYFSADAHEIAKQFTSIYDSVLSQDDAAKTSEISKVYILIKEFKRTLSAVLKPGEHFDRLMGLVSSILNEALSKSEQQKIDAAMKKEESISFSPQPKSRVIQLYDKSENMSLLSVGIDIGSSTTHLVFSRLALNRERSFSNPSNRFMVVDRVVLYESDIIFTPLIDRLTIDVGAILEFCDREYRKAGFTPKMVDSGAVIVTGEMAKKQNAEEIVKRLSSASGKFVSAVAGPNYESVLGAMGSGTVNLSKETDRTIMNVDIGGGTSNLAIAKEGIVLSTSCINVGGRLLGIDEDFKIWRIDEPTNFVMKELGLDYKLGDTIKEEDARAIAREYARALVEVMREPAKSRIAKELMMTADLDFTIRVHQYSFSGGVAELFYGSDLSYDDIGTYLAEEIKSLVEELGLFIIEPENKIRATVIGAGAFSLSVSGSTCYFDKSIKFPINNIPVIPVNVTTDNYSPEIVRGEIKRGFAKFDMIEGEDLVALYFKDSLYRSYSWLQEFVTSIENALPESVSSKRMIILLFESDIGKMVGLMIHRETAIQHNLICLDELYLEEGDWIDIGAPIHEGQVFPITVKSLVFNQNKVYS
jgi:ethanolamine utilization protein EutA